MSRQNKEFDIRASIGIGGLHLVNANTALDAAGLYPDQQKRLTEIITSLNELKAELREEAFKQYGTYSRKAPTQLVKDPFNR